MLCMSAFTLHAISSLRDQGSVYLNLIMYHMCTTRSHTRPSYHVNPKSNPTQKTSHPAPNSQFIYYIILRLNKHGRCHQKMVTHQQLLVTDTYFNDYLNQLEPLVTLMPKIGDSAWDHLNTEHLKTEIQRVQILNASETWMLGIQIVTLLLKWMSFC